MAEKTKQEKPVEYGELEIRVNGFRDGVYITANANVLTAEHKINRDLLFRVARHVPVKKTDVFIELYDTNGDDVLRANSFADGDHWDVSATVNGKTEKFDEPMSETKRPGKGGKAGEIDTGPAVLKLATAVLKKYGIPIVQIASSTGPRVSQTDTQIATLNEAIASAEALKTGDKTNDAVVDTLIGTLKGQVAALTAKQENARKARASRKSGEKSTVSVPPSPLGEAAGNASK